MQEFCIHFSSRWSSFPIWCWIPVLFSTRHQTVPSARCQSVPLSSLPCLIMMTLAHNSPLPTLCWSTDPAGIRNNAETCDEMCSMTLPKKTWKFVKVPWIHSVCRFDLLHVHSGAENSTLVARTINVGETVLKVSYSWVITHSGGGGGRVVLSMIEVWGGRGGVQPDHLHCTGSPCVSKVFENMNIMPQFIFRSLILLLLSKSITVFN